MDVIYYIVRNSRNKNKMTPYSLAHDALFRAVADILVRDYIAPSETAETVAEWCEWIDDDELTDRVVNLEPSELAALIADVEGYERRQG